MRSIKRLAIGLAALLPLAAGAASADTWPQRAVTFIVPFAAGGGTDAFARPLAQQLDNQIKQRVLIENRAGAGGTAGASAAARSTPDGYTFFVGATHHAIAPAIYPNLSYDIERDFIPVAMISRPPHVVVVNPKRVTAKTLAELVSQAKQNPDGLTYASAGLGTTHHLAGELFKLLTGTKIRHVPYRGAGPAMQDLLAAQVDMAFDGLGSSASQIGGGYISGLAVAAPARVSAVPSVPTAAEAGVPGFEVATWYGIWAPKGTPADIVERLRSEVGKALATNYIKETWERNGSDVPQISGAEYGAFVTSEIAKWGKVVRDAGVKIDQ